MQRNDIHGRYRKIEEKQNITPFKIQSKKTRVKKCCNQSNANKENGLMMKLNEIIKRTKT